MTFSSLCRDSAETFATLALQNATEMTHRQEIIAYVPEYCRFYVADIYSGMRIALDFALDENGFECNEDNGTYMVSGRSVTVQSEPWYNKGVEQKHLG